jgi:hypothetical protein
MGMNDGQIQQAIAATTKGKPQVTWGEISDGVKAAGTIPKNGWGKVRNNLQGLINAGYLLRNTENIRGPELYDVLKELPQ